MNKEEKLKKWAKMELSEKLKWNGFKGFCDNQSFKDSTVFKRAKVKSTEYR